MQFRIWLITIVLAISLAGCASEVTPTPQQTPETELAEPVPVTVERIEPTPTATAIPTTLPTSTATLDFQQTAIFERYTPEGFELYLLPIRNSIPQKIMTLARNEWYQLSPDGLRLAVYFGENVRVIDLVTFEEIVLVDDVVLPLSFIGSIDHQFLSWSPKGDKLVVLMEGPSWQDTSLTNTTVAIFNIEQQSLDFVYDNGTFINEVAWSADSTLISFPEIEIPCYYFTEDCQRGEEKSTWNLTTLIRLSDNEWAFLSSVKLEPIDKNYAWVQNSICELDLSPTNEWVVYETPCMLGYVPFDTNGFIAPIQSSQPILPVLSEQYDADARYLMVQWVGETDRFLLALRSDMFGADKRSDSVLKLYRKDETAITLLNEVDIEGHNFAFPLVLSFSPDNQYVIQGLEDNYVLLLQLSDLKMTPTFLEIPTISANGLWLPEGYLTQSEDKIIFIHSETGEWEIVQDNLPEGFVLVGWQILEQ